MGLIKIYLFTFFYLLVFDFNAKSLDNSSQIEIDRIDSLMYQLNHKECVEACLTFLKDNPSNIYVNNILCQEYNNLREWENCIAAGNEFNKKHDYPLLNYSAIYSAYIEVKDFDNAKDISELSINKQKNIKEANLNIKKIKMDLYFSRALSLLISILLFFMFRFNYKNRKNNVDFSKVDFGHTLFISLSINFFLYFLFFLNSEYIWSKNINVAPSLFTHLVKYEIYDKDGIESFVLYSGAIFSILVTFFISRFKILKSHFGVSFALFIFSIISINYIGFHPPLLSIGDFNQVFILLFIVLVSLFSLTYFFNKNLYVFYLLIISFLVLICFKPISPISVLDNSIILFPALEMLHSHDLSQIFFQYDWFLSLIGLFYLKFNISLDLIQLPFQLSYLLFFLGVFIFSKKLLYFKPFSIYIFLVILIVKFYSYPHDSTYLFGQTPLRLDLWLIPLLLSLYFGIRHWSIALVLGLMLIFHKNLGIIYTVSYIQVLILLFILEIKKIQIPSLINLIFLHFKKNLVFILILGLSIITVFIIFGGLVPESAIMFSRLGINFLKISSHSFYWFLFPLYSIVTILLVKNKTSLSNEYFTTSFFILFLAIGSSMYYFGRSHDSQFIQVLPLPIITFFILIDILYRTNTIASILKVKLISIILLVFTVVIYSKNIFMKGELQISNYKKGRMFYSISSQPTKKDFNEIKLLTSGSNKVAFLYCGTKRSKDDLLFYLKGNYKLHSGKPLLLEVFADGLRDRIRELTSEGYYIVTSTPYYLNPILPGIPGLQSKKTGRYTVYYK